MSDDEYEREDLEDEYLEEDEEYEYEEEEDETEEEETEEEEGEEEEPDEELLTDEVTEEIKELSVIRNIDDRDLNHKIIKVQNPKNRVSSEIIQYTELTEAIGIRVSQIENGSPVLTDVSGLTSVYDMAKKEFFDRCSPLILRRIVKVNPGEVIVDQYKVREMVFPLIASDIKIVTDKQIQNILKK